MRTVINLIFTFILLASFILSAFSAFAADVSNAVANPGFEEEITTEWVTGYPDANGKIQITEEEAHSGTRSLMVYDRQMPNAWWLTAYQNDFTVPAKTEITISVWVKLEDGAGTKPMRICLYDKGGVDMIVKSGSPIEAMCSDSEWTLVKGTFRSSTELSGLRLAVNYYPDVPNESDYWGGIFYIDDFSVTGGASTTQPGVRQNVPTEYGMPAEESSEETAEESEAVSEEPSEEVTDEISVPAESDAVSQTAGKDEDKDGNSTLITILGCAAIVIMAAVAVYVIKKKKA